MISGAYKPAPLSRSGPRALPFGFSLAVHGTLLAMVALGPTPGARKERSLYEIAIKPHEQKLAA